MSEYLQSSESLLDVNKSYDGVCGNAWGGIIFDGGYPRWTNTWPFLCEHRVDCTYFPCVIGTVEQVTCTAQVLVHVLMQVPPPLGVGGMRR